MSKTKILIAVSAFVLSTLACNALMPTAEPASTMVVMVEPTSPPTPDTLPQSEASVPRVPVEEAMVALAAGAASIVDVRSPDAYALSHIKGSINIPLGEIELNPTGLTLDQEQWIITYCT